MRANGLAELSGAIWPDEVVGAAVDNELAIVLAAVLDDSKKP